VSIHIGRHIGQTDDQANGGELMACPDSRSVDTAGPRGGARTPRRYTLTEAGYAALGANEDTALASVRHPRARARWAITREGRAALDAADD
jgi:hypothetical protein